MVNDILVKAKRHVHTLIFLMFQEILSTFYILDYRGKRHYLYHDQIQSTPQCECADLLAVEIPAMLLSFSGY